ncbi:MAG: hypothetical protein HY299_15045 [Verrucomicrobia bacterium]|nr:hypothetical protein [Verrucomicrobiota bacterium]
MKHALGTRVAMTVFRKLAPLNHLTSYSHRGGYYSLPAIAGFDEHGLWMARGAWFSKHGTLLDTAEAFVHQAPAGTHATELEARLHVPVKDVLRQLTQAGRIHRSEHEGLYLYSALSRKERQRQLAARNALAQTSSQEHQAVQAAIVLFYSLLDEKQRRIFAGLESLKLGHGGDRKLAQLLGLSEETVARGRRELADNEVLPQRVRRSGGGRQKVEKKRPIS